MPRAVLKKAVFLSFVQVSVHQRTSAKNATALIQFLQSWVPAHSILQIDDIGICRVLDPLAARRAPEERIDPEKESRMEPVSRLTLQGLIPMGKVHSLHVIGNAAELTDELTDALSTCELEIDVE